MFDGGLRNIYIEIALVGAGGDLAYEISRYTLVVGSVGPSEVRTHARYLVVHRRQEDGLWKTVAHIYGM
jgi:ketosteroid isomerase-like protein